MAINPALPHVPQPDAAVIQWLLDGDPAIRWQVLRDLTGAPPPAEIAVERTRVATEPVEHAARPAGAGVVRRAHIYLTLPPRCVMVKSQKVVSSEHVA